MNRKKLAAQAGSVLVLSLWATALLASIGISQAARLSLQYRWVDRLREDRQARFLAVSAFQLGAARLTTADPLLDNSGWDAPRESWGQPLQKPVVLSSGTFQYRITDEQSKISLNGASAEVLARLPGFSQVSAEALVARRVAGGTITHFGQLALLPEFDSTQLDKLVPLATCWGQGPVNLNTALPDVLLRVGLSAAAVDPIQQYRLGTDGVSGTADDGVFSETTAVGVETALKTFFGPGFLLAQPDRIALESFFSAQPPVVGIKSSFFSIEGEGKTQRRSVVKRISAVVDSGGTVRGWHEN